MELYLPIEFCRFNVAQSVGFRRGQNEQIGRDKLVVFQPDYITHLAFIEMRSIN